MPRAPLLFAGALATLSPPLRAEPADQLWLGLQFSLTLGPVPEGADPVREGFGLLFDARWQRLGSANGDGVSPGFGPFIQMNQRWHRTRLAGGLRGGPVSVAPGWGRDGYRVEKAFDLDAGLAWDPRGSLGIHVGAGAQFLLVGARVQATAPLRDPDPVNPAEPTLAAGFMLPLIPEEEPEYVPGRPVRREGKPLAPDVEIWGSERPLTREARRWLRDARMEMAAVTAFAALARDLRRLRAPPRLVAWARRAAVEELGHAGLCLALGVRRAGYGLATRITALRLPDPVDADRAALFSRVVREAVLDGVQGEGQAAESAVRSALQAQDPLERAAWERIAAEEAGHARLARDILDWALRADVARAHQAMISV